MTTVDSITSALRAAHTQALKDKYDALISKAHTENARAESDYKQQAGEAYVQTKQKLRLLPQQLAALGIGGQGGEQVASALMSEYSEQLRQLTEDYENSREDGESEIARQTALRDSALREYKLRNAVSDAKSAKSACVSSSGVSGSASGGQGDSAEKDGESGNGPLAFSVEDILDYYGGRNIKGKGRRGDTLPNGFSGQKQ